MSQAIPLVPSIRKDIKADLASCQVGRGNTKAKGGKEANDLSLENVPFTRVSNWIARFTLLQGWVLVHSTLCVFPTLSHLKSRNQAWSISSEGGMHLHLGALSRPGCKGSLGRVGGGWSDRIQLCSSPASTHCMQLILGGGE